MRFREERAAGDSAADETELLIDLAAPAPGDATQRRARTARHVRGRRLGGAGHEGQGVRRA